MDKDFKNKFALLAIPSHATLAPFPKRGLPKVSLLKRIILTFSIIPLFSSQPPPYKLSSIELFFSSQLGSSPLKTESILWIKDPQAKTTPQFLQDLLKQNYKVTLVSPSPAAVSKTYKALKPTYIVLPLSLKNSLQKIFKNSPSQVIFYPCPSKEKYFTWTLPKKLWNRKKKATPHAMVPLQEGLLMKKLKITKKQVASFSKVALRKKTLFSRFQPHDKLLIYVEDFQETLLGLGGFLQKLSGLPQEVFIVSPSKEIYEALYKLHPRLQHLTPSFSLESLLTSETKNIYVYTPHKEGFPLLSKTYEKRKKEMKRCFYTHPEKTFYLISYKVPVDLWATYPGSSELYHLSNRKIPRNLLSIGRP
ncbi:MAG: hypothetical protein FJZ63_00015 [Chlamydiae bacterium]|nr:hypothetical protein [Chlamydiota bacterium]